MLIPIRCFTCGKPIAHLYNNYTFLVSEGLPVQEALDRIRLKRVCCRRMFLSHVDVGDKILQFHSSRNSKLEEGN